jgi:hypothetical protein
MDTTRAKCPGKRSMGAVLSVVWQGRQQSGEFTNFYFRANRSIAGFAFFINRIFCRTWKLLEQRIRKLEEAYDLQTEKFCESQVSGTGKFWESQVL